ncbi:MAG: pyridoxamine 5'-phosphate oxidase [Acidimicrobiia bacterium]
MAATDRPLDEGDVDPDPIAQFRRWYDDAVAHGADQPDAMVVATVAADGAPNARVVLLRGVDDDGFRFFTNLESTKGVELAADPRVAVLFHWRETGRQVRARGVVEPVPAEEALAYWLQRPRESRISAWASRQSEPIASRAAMERTADAVLERLGDDGDVDLPPFWGGYRVVVHEVELWQHRAHRFHDRLRYSRTKPPRAWTIERLQP